MGEAKVADGEMSPNQDDKDLEDARRCGRFIQEFWDDIEDAVQPERLVVSDWRPSFDEHKGCVRLCATAYNNRGAYCNLAADVVFFDPKDPDKDTIQRLSRLLSISPLTVTERLRRAGLLNGR
jgi:hypothetical protein